MNYNKYNNNMSLIITNKKTLKDTAIIILHNGIGKNIIEKIGDLTIIKDEKQVVGVNVFNYSKYFDALEGAHILNELQINAIEKLGLKIKHTKSKFIIGEIISKNIHPKTDKLFLLKVKTDKELTIVTNAKNVEKGKKVLVATNGSTLPSGFAIVPSKVMGIESEGMLISGATLGLGETEGVLLVEGNNGDEYIF